MSGLMDRVAGAPITWGVCEVPGWGFQLPSDRVLAEMSAIGLRATELGPEGFLPRESPDLRALLGEVGLELVGGFLPMVLHREPDAEDGLAQAAAYADLLAAAGSEVLVLAASTAESGYETTRDLDREGWRTLLDGIERVTDLAAERGLTVAVHPHHGTMIERSRHVDRLLETSRALLCLDTGHLMLGGADPLDLAGSAASRIGHVHLKDVAPEWAERVRARHTSYREGVRSGMYRPLGRGGLDVAAIVATLHRSGYRGWYVLEQDTVLETAPGEGAGPALDASASLELFRRVAEELDQEDSGRSGRGTRAAHRATS